MTALGLSKKERTVLGFMLLSFVLVGFAGTSFSRLDVRGAYVPPDPILGTIMLGGAGLTLVVTIVLAVRYLGAAAGFKTLVREGWPGFLAGAGGGGVVGFFLRAMFGPGMLVFAVLLYVAAVFFIFWFAKRPSS